MPLMQDGFHVGSTRRYRVTVLTSLPMSHYLKETVDQYDPKLPLDHAATIPSSWYTNKDFYEHEINSVFSLSWQFAARLIK